MPKKPALAERIEPEHPRHEIEADGEDPEHRGDQHRGST